MEIRIKGLTRDYYSEGKRIRALDNIDLTIPANRIFTLLGPSGCGKTTLLRCIVGLETPDAGEIAIGGEIVWSGPSSRTWPGKAASNRARKTPSIDCMSNRWSGAESAISTPRART